MFKKITITISLCALFMQCAHKNKKAVATIDGSPIFVESVDSTIHDKLYERLYDIYYNRKIALEHLVSFNLLKKEAISRNISVDSLLKLEVEGNMTQQALDKLVAENGLAQGIPDPDRIGYVIDPASERGKLHLDGVLRRKLERDFVAGLKTKYHAEILLQPPLSPKINLQNIIKYPINNPVGNLEVILISDFDCDGCKISYPVFKQLISQYANKISFYYAPYANVVSAKMSFSACALKTQQNFSDIFKAFFESNGDSLQLENISRNLQLNHTEVLKCMQENQKPLLEQAIVSFNELTKKEITRTPTIIIDGRVYHGELTVEGISNYIDQVIL